jgi:geranylgeranyl reductase family protein
MMFDVAVIGAGPAGSMLARLLGEKGYLVALIEEHAQPGDPVNCSGIIGIEAFQRFELPDEHTLRSIDSFRFFSPGGASLSYRHHSVMAVAVNRARFDISMAARAVACGAVLMNHSRVNGIRIEPSTVYITINHKSILQSRFVVIATGAGSKLSKLIGLGAPQKFTLGAQTECEVRDLDDIEIRFGRRVAPSNFAWIIPLQENRAKVGLLADTGATQALRHFIKSATLSGKIVAAPNPVQCSFLPLDTIPRSFTDRTLVVGEAAGQIKTITCGGIYYALRAAEIAADVLDRALRKNKWDANFLSVYERRWKSLLGKELKMGLRMRSIFARLTDDRLDQLFDLAGQDGLMDLIREKANFDWHRDLVMAVFRHSLVRSALDPVGSAKLLL